MTLRGIKDHPERYRLSNELHARPFPELDVPCRAIFLALKQPEGAAERDRSLDLDHLKRLLDRYGAPHPPPDASHYSGPVGRGILKWEMHTEFVTYTIFVDGAASEPFSGDMIKLFPQEWLAASPGAVIASCLVRVDGVAPEDVDHVIETDLGRWFVSESIAIARVLDGDAVVASDFRIDENGHSRIAVLAKPGIGRRRLGRIVQRLLEIETYKDMAMLTLPRAWTVAVGVARLDRALSDIVAGMATERGDEPQTLDLLLKMSAEIEYLSSTSAFRFGAAEAYEAIVNQRIRVLREERIGGRQIFEDFMTRRFDPAMRTCRSAKARLAELSGRAERAANLLRTRVDVETQQQSAQVLRQMDERAALQLRLQETVEGLSVVAISYYGVSLAANVAGPLLAPAGFDKTEIMAILTVPVVLVVWAMIRRLRARIAHGHVGQNGPKRS